MYTAGYPPHFSPVWAPASTAYKGRDDTQGYEESTGTTPEPGAPTCQLKRGSNE